MVQAGGQLDLQRVSSRGNGRDSIPTLPESDRWVAVGRGNRSPEDARHTVTISAIRENTVTFGSVGRHRKDLSRHSVAAKRVVGFCPTDILTRPAVEPGNGRLLPAISSPRSIPICGPLYDACGHVGTEERRSP